MARFHLIAKFTFFVVIVFSAGLIIERITGIKRWWEANSLKVDDIKYNASLLESGDFRKILSNHYRKCLTQPAKPFCLLSANKRLEIFKSEPKSPPNVEVLENKLQNITSAFESRRRRIHSLLIAFTGLMKTNDVKVVLIEPSMLFCLLSSATKFQMLSDGFNPGSLLGSRNIVTVAISDEDSEKLETGNFTREALSAGFKLIKFSKLIERKLEKSFETVHYFFILEDVAVHAVIFYHENSYFRHARIDPKEIDFEGLLYVNEGIFENFKLLHLDLAKASISQMFVPYDIRYFLKDIESSRVLQCNFNASGIPATHLSLTKDQLRKRVMITLKELKTILIPRVAFFWLWSKSLLGWFTECDTFHYSPSLHLALKFKSIQEMNFTELLDDNEFLRITNQSNKEFKYEMDCHGLLVNLYLLHEDEDMLWYNNNETQKFSFPVFSLCSTQVLGEKIHVPCNTDEILKLENRQNRANHTSIEDIFVINETES